MVPRVARYDNCESDEPGNLEKRGGEREGEERAGGQNKKEKKGDERQDISTKECVREICPFLLIYLFICSITYLSSLLLYVTYL